MTTPKSKLLGDDKLGDDKPREPARDSTSAADASAATTSTATTSERDPAASRRSLASDDARLEQASLPERLLRIEREQCDALVTIVSEQGHGRVWCVAGNVIDAEWRRRDTHA